MHRLGFDKNTATRITKILQKHPALSSDLWLMTHFASADDIDNSSTTIQIQAFDAFCQVDPSLKQTVANSAGLLAWPHSHKDWVRPGIILYGACPLIGQSPAQHQLQAAMELHAPLISIHHLKKGESIGYSATFCCEHDMTVGVVACGYADGYPRHAPSGTPVWLNNQYTSIVGRVSMDMLVIDLNNITTHIGDRVELWGTHVAVDDVATRAKTISYEILCHAGNNCKSIS